MENVIKTSAVNYSYLQNSGRWARRNLVCAENDVQFHINRLLVDPKAKNVSIAKK